MTDNKEYFLNNAGAKILSKCTNSYKTFMLELGNLEFFIMFILMADTADKESFKASLIESYESHSNKASEALVKELNNDKENTLLSSDRYEMFFGQMAFSRIVDNCLGYFKDILSEIIRKRPEILKSKEKESLNYILNFNSMEEFIEDIVEKKIQQLFYGNIKDIKNYFIDKLGINLFENDIEEKQFEQIIKQRNLIVHNRGLISKELIEKYDYPSEMLDKPLHFHYVQLSEVNKIVNNVIVEIEIKLRIKFKIDTTLIT